jgi:hypothetical protein
MGNLSSVDSSSFNRRPGNWWASDGKAARRSLWHLKQRDKTIKNKCHFLPPGGHFTDGYWAMIWNRFERRGADKIVKQMFRCGVCKSMIRVYFS